MKDQLTELSIWLYRAMSLWSVLNIIMATIPDRKRTITKEFMILKGKSLLVETLSFQNNPTKKYVQYLTPDTIATNLPKTYHTVSVSRNMTAVTLIF